MNLNCKRNLLFIFSIILNCLFCTAQDENAFIKINAKVFDKENTFAPFSLMVINAHSNTGTMGTTAGEFSIYGNKTDTFLISALGFNLKKICFKDSIPKKEYAIKIELQKKSIHPQTFNAMPQIKNNNSDLSSSRKQSNNQQSQANDSIELKNRTIFLKPISVYGIKSLEEIQKDFSKLGVKQTNVYRKYNSLESPITSLYEAFSKIEQSKRKVAALENEDFKKEVLKDLFRIYVKADIINLSELEFDNFIWYCDFSDTFIKNATTFDLVKAIKERYEVFSLNKK